MVRKGLRCTQAAWVVQEHAKTGTHRGAHTHSNCLEHLGHSAGRVGMRGGTYNSGSPGDPARSRGEGDMGLGVSLTRGGDWSCTEEVQKPVQISD